MRTNVTEHQSLNVDLVDESNLAEEVEETDEEEEEDSINEELEESFGADIPSDSVLDQYFEELQLRLQSENVPAEYENGTFWIVPMMPFFALKKKLNVEYLYRPRVFLWVPHLLTPLGLNGLHCSECNSSLENKDYNKKPRARRIVDLTG